MMNFQAFPIRKSKRGQVIWPDASPEAASTVSRAKSGIIDEGEFTAQLRCFYDNNERQGQGLMVVSWTGK